MGGRAAGQYLHRLLTAVLRTTEFLQICVCVEGLNKHQVLVLAAYNLGAVPCYPEARRICTDPIVIVPSDSKVAETGRVSLRARFHGTLATVNVDCVRAVGRCLMCVRVGNHNFVVSRAERSEVVTFFTDHDAGILSCQSEECKSVAGYSTSILN